MLNPKEIIIDVLKKWKEENSIGGDFDVSLSQNLVHGDFSTNFALIAYRFVAIATESHVDDFRWVYDKNNIWKNPKEAAETIQTYLEKNQGLGNIFEKIEVAGPGFINFYLSKKYLLGMLTKDVQLELDHNVSNKLMSHKKKIMVEFGDPNPFKEIHIGHLRNFCIGESFSRLLEADGNNVVRVNYQGDVGLHVAKCLFGVQKKELGISDLTAEKLAECYAYGATEFENNENAKQEIIEINKKIYAEDDSLKKLWEEGRKVSLEHFDNLYKRIGVFYKKYYFESQTAVRGREIVLSHIDDGIFERNEGAVVYRGEKEGLHTRVFLTSQDYATYEGKDLALAIMKNEDAKPDLSYILTGNEQLEYFQVMLSALAKIEPEVSDKTKHYTFGHVRLKEGKMSSRTGDVIKATWLLDEAVKKVKEQFSDIDNTTAEKVGVGAVKYSMLKFGIASDIHFDFSESISLEGNSGPYLMYAYVRTQSVLNKSSVFKKTFGQEQIDLNKEEEELLRFLSQYPYHLEQARNEFAPNLVCNYLFELSQKFNLFYQKHKIIGGENEAFRLALIKAVGDTIKSGLFILGIDTVEKM